MRNTPIRNTLKYISYKDSKEFMADLKKVYKAPTEDAAQQELDPAEAKWGKKYPLALKSWHTNWLMYLSFSSILRRSEK